MMPPAPRTSAPTTLLAALAATLSLLAAALAPATAAARRAGGGRCTGAHTQIRHSTLHRLRAAEACLINRQRIERGLPRLHVSRDLNRSAQRWTDHMVRDHEFTHGTDFSARISDAGFDWSQAGENIATGFRTPAAVVRGWMRSTGHCENILDPDYRYVGTGVSAARTIVAPGTWTQDFGLRMGQRAPSGNHGPEDSCPF